jgi:quercetin dioxygenase-like cupin family protein
MTRAAIARYPIPFAAILALALGLRLVPAVQAAGVPVSTFLQSEAAGGQAPQWKVVTVELGPGAVDSRSVRPGRGVVYVLTGGGLLELDGKATIGLHPGVAVALNPDKRHVLKNTTDTETLRVLVVSLQDKSRSVAAR